MNRNLVLGADIGGTHITASLVDLQKRQILSSTLCRKEIDSNGSAEAIITAWSEVMQHCFSKSVVQQKKIGIAMPGPADYDSGICYIQDQAKYQSLYGRNIKELLGQQLGIAREDILMINDAAGFLSGEVFIGAGKGFTKVVGFTLGTGLGSAVYRKGVVADADLWRAPFLGGIAEDYLSARWLLGTAIKITGRSFDNVKQLADLAPGDPAIRGMFNEFGRNLGTFAAEWLQQEQAEVLILGGNIARSHRLFLPAMTKKLKERGLHTEVRIAEVGESAALVGAAVLWERRLPVVSGEGSE
jgi:glucokinase